MLGTDWRKASLSFSNSNCVQVRLHEGMVQVRDSKNKTGPVLRVTTAAWKTFLANQRTGTPPTALPSET